MDSILRIWSSKYRANTASYGECDADYVDGTKAARRKQMHGYAQLDVEARPRKLDLLLPRDLTLIIQLLIVIVS